MIDKKSLIINIAFIIFVTIVLILQLTLGLDETIKYILIGTIGIMSAFLFLFNKTNKGNF